MKDRAYGNSFPEKFIEGNRYGETEANPQSDQDENSHNILLISSLTNQTKSLICGSTEVH